MPTSQPSLSAWNKFALVYLVATILPLTLTPFEFDTIVPSYGWTYQLTLEDFARNILLFLPLGIVGRYAFNRGHWIALIGGVCFSLSIEVTQLFIAVRTSNIADLLGNGSGAFLGSLLCHKLLSKHWSLSTIEIPLAFMFVPLCWISALRSLTDPFAAPLTLFSFLAGLILIQLSPPKQPFPYFLGAFWLVLAIIPFFNTQPSAAIVFTAAAPFALYATATRSVTRLKTVAVSAALLGLASAIISTGVWYFLPDVSVVTFELILRVSEIVFYAIAATATLTWYKSSTH